jgi:hypothetical protein
MGRKEIYWRARGILEALVEDLDHGLIAVKE